MQFLLLLEPISSKISNYNKKIVFEIRYCGQSYKHFMLINYDSRVVPDWKIPHITTLES